MATATQIAERHGFAIGGKEFAFDPTTVTWSWTPSTSYLVSDRDVWLSVQIRESTAPRESHESSRIRRSRSLDGRVYDHGVYDTLGPRRGYTALTKVEGLAKRKVIRGHLGEDGEGDSVMLPFWDAGMQSAGLKHLEDLSRDNVMVRIAIYARGQADVAYSAWISASDLLHLARRSPMSTQPRAKRVPEQDQRECYWPENEIKRRRQSSPIENPSSPSENANNAAIAASTATRPEADLRPAAIKPEDPTVQAAATSRMELPDMLNDIRRHLGMPNAEPKDLIAEAEPYGIDLSLCRTFRDKAQKLYDELR